MRPPRPSVRPSLRPSVRPSVRRIRAALHNVGAGRTDDADEKRGEIPILALGALRSVARSRSADLI